MDTREEIGRGEALFSSGKIEAAKDVFRQIVEKDPDNFEAANNLGAVCYTLGDEKAAEAHFLRALEVKKDYTEALNNISILCQDGDRWHDAALYLETLVSANPKDTDALHRLATAYLKTGRTEKARKILSESLEMEPDRENSSQSPSAFTAKTAIREAAVEKSPMNILFVQDSPCIRNYKMATALRSIGHDVSLAYTVKRLSQMYPGLSDDTYNACIHLKNYRDLWDISGNYDLVHCHNEPDILTVAALAGDAPVIHDTHDLISLRANGDATLSYFEGVANRGATGRVYSTPYQKAEAEQLYGINGPSLVFYNYASEADLNKNFLPKLSRRDGKIHIVYEGGVGGSAHRDFSGLFVQLGTYGIHIHIYPATYNHGQAQFFSQYPSIHYYPPVSPKKIIEEMTQYDYGIIPFNLEKGNKRFLDSTIANKLFEYLAAGLPVITSPLKTYVDYFRQNPAGLTFQNAEDLVKNIPKLKQISEAMDFSKQVFTYEREITTLETFYKKIINSVPAKEKREADKIFISSPEQETKGRETGTEKSPIASFKTTNSNPFGSISRNLIVKETSHRPLLDLAKTQWLSTEELEKIQNAFLKMLVSEVYEKVPFYRRIMDETNTDPARVHSIADLRRMPILDKDTIRAHYAEIQHIDFDTLEKHYTGTGGSTGKALKYFVPPEVYYYGFGCRNRGFSWAGFDENRDRVAYLAGGSLGVTDTVEIEGNKIRVPATGITDRSVMKSYYEALESFLPDYMRAYPSALFEFCKFLRDEEKTLHLKAVVTTAEMLYDYQRSFIENILGCKIFNEYGAYDGGAGAFECNEHCGLHLQMERGIVELLNANGDPVKPGEAGRVIVTDLHNYLMPFIRYDVGDMAIASDRLCECGRGLKIIESIEGRSSDFIVLGDGTRISGESMVHLFNKLLHTDKIDIEQYQVVQRADSSVVIRIIPGKLHGMKDQRFIQNTFEKHLKGLVVKTETVSEIEPTSAGKRRFVLSEMETHQSWITSRSLYCKKEKPKICHIGGAHSVHISDIVKELDKRGYEQCVVSYFPIEKSITPNHIPVYYFPYNAYESPEWQKLQLEVKLERFLERVFKEEKPDIIHGHSLTYSCIPVWMAKERFGLPTIIVPWSINSIRNPNKIINDYEKRCMDSCDYLLTSTPGVFKLFQSYYGNIPDNKFVLFKPLVDLSLYEGRRPISAKPVILSARVMGDYYRQDLLIKALPILLKEAPDLQVSLIIGQNADQGKPYFDKMIRLAKSLGVYNYCNFIPKSLSQPEFADLIRTHNIIYAPAIHDVGFSCTALQAMISGAVVIAQVCPYTEDLLVHKKNLLRTHLNEKSVREILIYAVKNLVSLQEKFIKENEKFKMYEKNHMVKNLMDCYQKLYSLSEKKPHEIRRSD